MSIIDPIMQPLLSIDPFWSIVIIALFVSLISVLATKFMTNQKLMKEHRAELKKLQKEMKACRDNPKKAMSLQKKMMDINMIVMKESFKPMIITIIPFLLIFAWLNANFSYLPIQPQQEFAVYATFQDDSGIASINITPDGLIEFVTNQSAIIINGRAGWRLKGDEGIYTINFIYEGSSVQHDLVIGQGYTTPEVRHSGLIRRTIIDYEPLKINMLGVRMKWIWAYIILSLIFSIVVRKALKVH